MRNGKSGERNSFRERFLLEGPREDAVAAVARYYGDSDRGWLYIDVSIASVAL